MNNQFLLIITLLSNFSIGCFQNQKIMNSYVIEITTFKYNVDVDSNRFWESDKEIETNYTSKQPGFISRESAFSENDNEIVVVARWETQANAEASMKKFMTDTSVQDYVQMIDGKSMKMTRYQMK